jgi:hypothetical protein
MIFTFGFFLGLRLNTILEKIIRHKTIILLSCCIAMAGSVVLLIIDLVELINIVSMMSTFFVFSMGPCGTICKNLYL